jgi:hypothetical protein
MGDKFKSFFLFKKAPPPEPVEEKKPTEGNED